VIYLFDVNALLALVFTEHEFHHRVDAWIGKLLKDAATRLATCAITELGFVRVASTVPSFGVTYHEAQAGLARLKASRKQTFMFFGDNLGADRLPTWVRAGRQTTDGHLMELAKTHSAELATLDERIPKACLIP
jgi:predicted nucleic acid-binding protein